MRNKLCHSPNRVSVHVIVYVMYYLFKKKNQLINVHKHKFNCFHRSVHRFMIDLCSYLSVTQHAFQRNCISPLFLVHLLPSDFKIDIHYCIHIYMFTIFDGKKLFTLYLHIKP